MQQTEGKGLISKHKIRSFYLYRIHQFVLQHLKWVVIEIYTFDCSLIFYGLQYLNQENRELSRQVASFGIITWGLACMENMQDTVPIVE